MCWPVHSNKVERVPQSCWNENYRKLLQLHACRIRYLFLLYNGKNHQPQRFVICSYRNHAFCWKSCIWIRRSYHQEQLVKQCQKNICISNSYKLYYLIYKFYLIWTHISQRQFPNNFEFRGCSYEKWASSPRWDLTWFCRDPT